MLYSSLFDLNVNFIQKRNTHLQEFYKKSNLKNFEKMKKQLRRSVSLENLRGLTKYSETTFLKHL